MVGVVAPNRGIAVYRRPIPVLVVAPWGKVLPVGNAGGIDLLHEVVVSSLDGDRVVPNNRVDGRCVALGPHAGEHGRRVGGNDVDRDAGGFRERIEHDLGPVFLRETAVHHHVDGFGRGAAAGGRAAAGGLAAAGSQYRHAG